MRKKSATLTWITCGLLIAAAQTSRAAELGASIQHTIKTLHEPGTNGPPFRVLFYGQSITLQYWWVELSQWVQTNFPNRSLEIVNRALPGFTSDYLHRSAEADLYPFYPDLLVFQDYGPPEFYEAMIRKVRRRTTSDIIIQTDHITLDSELNEPTSPDDLLSGQPANAWRNYVFLPNLAASVGAELADIRSGWKQHLVRSGLSASNLLSDHIHLNRAGEILMRDLLKPHFRVPNRPIPERWPNAFQLLDLKDTSGWSNGVLRTHFVGNRIHLSLGPMNHPLKVRIDGRAPSEFPELYHFARASVYPNSPWPFLIGLSSRTPLLDETWTFRVLEFWTSPSPGMRFALTGSETGPDGEGTSTRIFVSNSGRLVIEPEDWTLWLSFAYANGQPMQPGQTLQLPVTFSGTDVVPSSKQTNLRTFTLAQGLANGAHVLELDAGTNAPPHLESLHIFDPLARQQSSQDRTPKFHQIAKQGTMIRFNLESSGRCVVEKAKNSDGPWAAASAPLDQSWFEEPLHRDQTFYRLRAID